MNSKERVFAAIQGQPMDRRPFTAVLSLYGAHLTGCPLRQYYSDPSSYARGQTAVHEAFQPDLLLSSFSLVALAEAFGGEAKYFGRQPPNLLWPAIASADDVRRLRVPDVDSHPRLLFVRESLRRLAEAHGAEVALAAILLSPAELPIMILGIDKWLEAVLFNQDAVNRVLDITKPFFVDYANALLADGADALVLPAAFLTPAVATRQIVTDFALPIFRETFSLVQGPIIIHHAGGPFLKFLDLFAGLPNVIGFALDHRDDPAAGREKIGTDACLFTGPDGPSLASRPAEEIEAQCTSLLEDRRDDPRFMLFTSGPDVPFDTPPENISALRRAVTNFGAPAVD